MNIQLYPFDAKRDYEAVMVAWVQQLLNSPTCLATYNVNRAEFVEELIPVLDAWVMRPGALKIYTDDTGGWLAIREPIELALVSGQKIRQLVMERMQDARVWHGNDAFAATANHDAVWWRLFTECPDRYNSDAALRRMARALKACQDHGLCG